MNPVKTQLLVAISAIIIFLVDITIPLGVAWGVFYIIVILIALQTTNRHIIVIAAILSTLLVILGLVVSPEGGELWKVYFNRGISIAMIWITTLLGLNKLDKETALNKSEEKNKALYENSPLPYQSLDEDGCFLEVNSTWLRALGYDQEEVIGKYSGDFIHSDWRKKFEIKYSEFKRRGYISDVVLKIQHKSGHFLDIQFEGSVEHNPDGSFNKTYCVFQDITKNKKIEEALRHSHKMDALGNLTGGIAHDFNNLLGVVIGYAELLEKKLDDQPHLAKYVHEINHAGERGAKLTKKLLAFSRQTEVDAESLNLNSLLQNEQQMLKKTLTVRIKLTLNLQENIWPIWVDASEMGDATLNMCINAMHAIEGNGILTIQTRNQTIHQVDAQPLGLIPGDYVLLSITDTGCGMDEITKDKIFEPFFSTKGDRGTGLGLSQVYGFVQRSSATIKFYSELNHGTRFIIYFPRYHENSRNERPTKDYSITTFTGNKSILVVDDDEALLDLASEVLSQQGYHVICAGSAKQAVEILEQEPIDLLLTDIIMPEMNGYELAAIVQKKYPNIKIQLASGFSGDDHTDMLDDSLHDNLLNKPYHSQTLLKRIRELLSEK